MEETHGIRDAMRVYGPDGAFLGWVGAVGPEHFELSLGAAHPTVDYDIPITAVRDVSRWRVVLRDGLECFSPIEEDAGTNLPPPGGEALGEGEGPDWESPHAPA